jgi:hypothetical protein
MRYISAEECICRMYLLRIKMGQRQDARQLACVLFVGSMMQ